MSKSYVSKFTGEEIDNSIQKSKDINSTAGQININMETINQINNDLLNTSDNELLAKNANGKIKGVSVYDEGNKIFFGKDGRFPSNSIDVGPSITISENGGWTQYKAQTLGNQYIYLDYKIDSNGTERPIYWKRLAEENEVAINLDDTLDMYITSIIYQPQNNSQINSVYMKFVEPVSNLIMEIISAETNEVIKYIPNEKAWKENNGGISVDIGEQEIKLTTPISVLTSYNLIINFNSPIHVKGNGSLPYLKFDRQLIEPIGVLLVGEGTGSPDTSEQIRDKLSTLIGEDRLDATYIKNLPIEINQNIYNVLNYGDDANNQGIYNLKEISTKNTLGTSYWLLNTDENGSFRIRNENNDVFLLVESNGKINDILFLKDGLGENFLSDNGEYIKPKGQIKTVINETDLTLQNFVLNSYNINDFNIGDILVLKTAFNPEDKLFVHSGIYNGIESDFINFPIFSENQIKNLFSGTEGIDYASGVIKIEDYGIETIKINNNAITTEKINDSAITYNKLEEYLKTRINNGFIATVGNGTNSNFTINHNLNTKDIIVQFYKIDSGESIQYNFFRTPNTITFTATPAPTLNNLRVLIHKINTI